MKGRPHRERIPPGVVKEIKTFHAWSSRRLEAANYEPARPLYHYTDLMALDAILASEKFRLTGLSQLRRGDRVEIEYGINQLVAEIREYKPKSAAHGSLLTAVLRMFSFQQFTQNFDCYVGSFTLHAHDADLWKRFGRDGAGVAIEFVPSYFKAVPPTPGVTDFILAPVKYGRDDSAMELRKALDASADPFTRAIAMCRDKRHTQVALLEFIQDILGSFGIPLAVNTKEPSFRIEQEVRGVHLRSAVSRGTEPRPDYVYAPAPRSAVGNLYYGNKVDITSLREIWQRHSMPGKLLPAIRP